MEGVLSELEDRIVNHLRQQDAAHHAGKQLWIALAGPPGSGKSTICSKLVKSLTARGIPAAILPMDGFHYYRSELDTMQNREEAHARRGAHWTFNAHKFVDVLSRIKDDGSGRAPSFDHAHGDPVEGAISIEREHKVVLVEGNYVLLYDVEPWSKLQHLFDEKWLVTCPEHILRERVIQRNAAAWGWDRERTAHRVDANDMVNARLVMEVSTKHADRVIESQQDDAWCG